MNLFTFLLRSSRGVVSLCVLAGIVGGVGGVGLIALIHAGLARDVQSGRQLAWAFAALCLLTASMRVVAQAATARLAQGAVAGLRTLLCERILALPLMRFEAADPAGLLAVLTEDIVVVANAFIGIPLLCINLPIIVACLAFVGWLSPVALACGLGFAVPALLVDRVLMAKGLDRFKRARAGQDALVAHFRSLIAGFRELKLHRGRREAFLRGTRHDSGTVRDRTVAGLTFYAVAGGWSQVAYFGVIGLLLFALPEFREIDRPTLAGLILVVLYIMVPLDVILGWVPVLGRARASMDRIEGLLPELAAAGPGEAPPARAGAMALRESLELRDVTFAYRGEPDGDGFVLGPINLAIRPGELIFLVGGNGGGKTTLVKLLAGLYGPDAGEVRVDGRPVGPGDRDAYRQLFSVVFADGHLFEALPDPDRPGLDARAADGLARLGLAGRVGVEAGAFSTTDLSQGQRRRLALLSVLLEDRPVCVFDEWAAHQDPHFKRAFYLELLPELKAAGKALLVISHDEDYFPIADRVVKLHEGLACDEGRAASGAIAPGWPSEPPGRRPGWD